MKHASSKAGLAACLVALFVLASPTGPNAFAVSENAAAERQVDLQNRDLFPEEFFPGLSDFSEDEVVLAGLRSLFPNRILDELPSPGTAEAAPPVVRHIGGTGAYIRVLDLPAALAVIEDHLSQTRFLVLDFRFLTTDLDSTLALASLLTRQDEVRLSRGGDFPVPGEYLRENTIAVPGRQLRAADHAIFTISSQETSGPIEALLAQLQTENEVISVGAPSAGQTASFAPFPGFDSYYLIRGDVRPFGGKSLVGTGFVPRVETAIDPHQDRLAYVSLREGVALDDLVGSRPTRPRSQEDELVADDVLPLPEEVEEDQPDLPRDLLLQRTLNIIKALQALGHISD